MDKSNFRGGVSPSHRIRLFHSILSGAIAAVAAATLTGAARAQSAFVADPLPVSNELSFLHERGGSCPKPSVSGPQGPVNPLANPMNPGQVTVQLSQYFEGGDSFSCPVLRFGGASVGFRHPVGGFSGTITNPTVNPSVVTVSGSAPLVARASAAGTATDTQGGDRHGFLAAAKADVEDGRQDRLPRNPACIDSDGFSTSSPASKALSAAVDCTLTDLRVIPASIEKENNQVVRFQAVLVSDAWLQADHGSGQIGGIQNGARYRVSLRTVYRFQSAADKIEFSMLDPDPADGLEPDAAQTFKPRIKYELRSSEKGKISLSLADAVNFREVESGEVARTQAGGAEIQLEIPNYPTQPEGEILMVAHLMDAAGKVLAESEEVAYKIAADLTIDHVEVVQVVQSASNSVPLIADKDTVVRVFTKIEKGPDAIPGVPVRLRGFRQGSELPGSPQTVDHDFYVTVKSPDRGEVTHSAVFFLPNSWVVEGALELRAEINPADGTGKREVDEFKIDNNQQTGTFGFQRTRALAIRYLPVCSQPSGAQKTCPTANVGNLAGFLTATYPVAEENVRYEAFPLPEQVWDAPLDSGLRQFQFLYWLNSLFQQAVAQSNGLIEFDQLVAWLPTGAAGKLLGKSDPRWLWGSGRVSMNVDTSQTDQLDTEVTMAHEVGHNLGLRHPNLADSCGAVDPDSDWFSSGNGGSTIQEHGFEPAKREIKLGRPRTNPAVRFDLMSYCSPGWRFWMSPFNYRRLIASEFLPQKEKLPSTPLSAAETRSEAAAEALPRPRQQAARPLLLIGGQVNRQGTEGRLERGYVIPSSAESTPPDPASGHCLRFSGAAGPLGQHCFPVAFIDPESGEEIDEVLFYLTVPLPAGVTRIGLFRAETELASIAVSPSPPAIQISAPSAGAQWQGGGPPQTVSWTASDPDGNALSFTLSYSSDGGAIWVPLASDIAELNYAVDPRRIMGGPNVRFRVLATDGLNTASAEVGPVNVVQQPNIETDANVDFGEALLIDAVTGYLPVRNTGSGPLMLQQATSNNPAFEISAPFPITVWPGSPFALPVKYSPSEEGDDTAVITIASDDPDTRQSGVNVRITVTDGQTPRAEVSPGSIDFRQLTAGTSSEMPVSVSNRSLVELNVGWTIQGQGFTVVGSGPQFSLHPGESSTIAVAFAPQSAGNFAGRLNIATNDPDRVNIQVDLAGTAVEASTTVPSVPPNGIRDAAQFEAILAPGGIGSIFGTNLADSTQVAASLPLPTNLGGTSVEINGAAAPLFFVSPLQINFQMRFEAQPGNVSLRVVRNGEASPPVQVQVQTFAPQLFANPPGVGVPIVTHFPEPTVVSAQNPAKSGDVLIVYATGIGGLDNPPPSGAAAIASPLAQATQLPTVTIGGRQAQVFFAGLTPGFAGLAQINIQVPDLASAAALNAAGGPPQQAGLPLVISFGAASSKPSTLPVETSALPPRRLLVAPNPIDLGQAAVGSSSTVDVTIQNGGSERALVNGVRSLDPQFTVEFPFGSLPFDLATGQQAMVRVRFTPTSAGIKETTFQASTSAFGVNANMRGEGTQPQGEPQLSIEPAVTDFGAVQVGQSATRDVAVRNPGGAPASVTTVVASDPQFTVEFPFGGLPFNLQPGGSQMVRVRFTPASQGQKQATLTAANSNMGANGTLRGSGIASAPSDVIVAAPSTLNFGPVTVGRIREVTLTVRNDGASAFSVTSMASSNPQFRAATPAAPFAIPAGTAQAVRVHFEPSAMGAQQAALTLTTSGGAMATVTLQGTGAQGAAVKFSDSFNRADAPNCAFGAADHAFGGTGFHHYAMVSAGARLRGNRLENASTNYGGVYFSTETAACPGSATDSGQDLNIRGRVTVPGDATRSTQAGPFFRTGLLSSGTTIHEGGRGGFWVRLDSSGEVRVLRLDTFQAVATSAAPAGFDKTVPHLIEAAVRGRTVEVAVDGYLRTFQQGNASGRQTVDLSAEGVNQGGAGLAFGATNGPGSFGGQSVDDLVVTEYETLLGLPVRQ